DSRCNEVIQRAGHIDVLVNFAGVGLAGALEMHSTEEARHILDTNVLGTFRMCKTVLPGMRARKSGRIVNVSSIGGLVCVPYLSLYSASKFAVEGMTESLRMEVRRYGVHVSLLEPGDFLTEMTQSYAWTQQSSNDAVYSREARRAVEIMERDCRGSTDLRLVALKLTSVLESGTPALRYTVGMLAQRLAVLAHRLMPDSWFEAIMLSTYKL